MPFDAMSTGCAVELSQKRRMTKTDTHTKAQVSNYGTPSRRRITHCGWILRNKKFLRNKWRIGSAPGLLLSREGVVPRGYARVCLIISPARAAQCVLCACACVDCARALAPRSDAFFPSRLWSATGSNPDSAA